MLSKWPQHPSHRVWCSSSGAGWQAARAHAYPCTLYAALVLEKKNQLFLEQHGAGNPDLTKEEIIVTDSLVFAAIF